jgi:type VI secretion system protein ImpE
MKPEDLFRVGKLDEAIRMLSSELRDDPSNLKKRTFLFELLCFAGEYDRAEKQLDLLGDDNQDAMLASLLYRGALNAEKTRQEMFRDGTLPQTSAGSGESANVSGSLNGKEFNSIRDADERIGAKLEIIAGGDYMWVGFENIAQLDLPPPKRVRDTFWAPGRLRTGSNFKGQDLGEILIPVLSPGSAESEDPAVRLGRVTEWYRDENGAEFPLGQKMLRIDGEEFPLLEVRKLEIHASGAASP